MVQEIIERVNEELLIIKKEYVNQLTLGNYRNAEYIHNLLINNGDLILELDKEEMEGSSLDINAVTRSKLPQKTEVNSEIDEADKNDTIPMISDEQNQDEETMILEGIDKDYIEFKNDPPGKLFDKEEPAEFFKLIKLKDLIKAQRADKVLGKYIAYIENGILPDDCDNKFLNKVTEYEIMNSVLLHFQFLIKKKRKNPRLQIAIPKCLEYRIMTSAHCNLNELGSHMAGLSMYANYKRYFHFEKMLEKMVEFAKSLNK